MSLYFDLIEDGDGIPPSGNYTTDVTPTLGWEASGGVSFAVSITSGSSFITSGVVVATEFTPPNTLSIGGYQAYLTVKDATQAALSTASGVFHIVAWLRAPRIYPSDDIVEATFRSPDYIRYLPQWMSVQRGTSTALASGSLLHRFFVPHLNYVAQVNNDVEDVISQSSVLSTPISLPRLWWHTSTPFSTRDTITATISASGTSGDIRRVTTLHEFMASDIPVFLVGDTGHIGFRNLAQRTVTLAPVGPSGLLNSQYWISDEGLGIVPDTDVFFTFPPSGTLYRIPAGSVAVDPDRAVIQLTEAFSGTIVFQYQSKTFASVLQVSLSGGIQTTPASSDLWNRFDELAVLTGQTRKPGEDNISFKNRIYARAISNIGIDAISVAQHVSQDLTLATVIPWDGRTTLDLATSGYYGVRRVDVVGVPEIGRVSEVLTPGVGWESSGSFQFYGSKADWLPGYFVLVNGIVADSLNYPGTTVSTNTLTFAPSVGPISGVVRASYQYRNYTPVLSDASFISRVIPSSGNLTSGDYRVVLTRNVRVFTAADPNYQRAFLLNANGTPNGEFLSLRDKIMEETPNHVGRSRWGRAYWVEGNEPLPPTEHLPLPWDNTSIIECSELTSV